jgi:DNA processing protein
MPAPLSDDVRALLVLHLTPGVGPRLTAALLERFGSAARVLRAGFAELRDVPHVGPKLAERLARARAGADVDEEIHRMERAGVGLTVLGTPEYPAALATIPDPPHLLYVRGALAAADARAVAVVGSRHCTDYGRKSAAQLSAALARAGVTIISGLARGIDGVAHRAALEAGGRTLAVLAGGLSRIYPPEHKGLAAEVEKAGALLTESCMTQEPLPGLFPARNRLISGLSRVVVIVEAPARSGALITASHAAEQGRTVMAVPGPIDAEGGGGVNALLRDGAVLCRGAQDVLEELDGVSATAASAKAAAPPAPVGPPPGLDDVQRRVWDFLAGGAKAVDEMAQHLGLGVPQLSGALLMLEMKKAVRRLPGNRYERVP